MPRQGFTLIEIVIVLMLLGILGAVAGMKYDDLLEHAEKIAASSCVAAAQTRMDAIFGNSLLQGVSCEEAAAMVDAVEKLSDSAKVAPDGSVIPGDAKFGDFFLGIAENSPGGQLSGERVAVYGGRDAEKMTALGIFLYPPQCSSTELSASVTNKTPQQLAVNGFIGSWLNKILTGENFESAQATEEELEAMGLNSATVSAQGFPSATSSGSEHKLYVDLKTNANDHVMLTLSDRRDSGNYHTVTLTKLEIQTNGSASGYFVVNNAVDAKTRSANLNSAKAVMQSAGLDVDNDFSNVFDKSYVNGEIAYLPFAE